MGNTFISCRNLCFSYSDEEKVIPVLKNINLDIEKGSFVAILGHNGSGKSTLAKLLNVILLPDSGELIIDGTKVSMDLTDKEVYEIRRKIGMVFQNPDNQLVATIVEEDVAFGPENLGIEPKEIRKRVDDSLELLGMKEYAKHSPHMLSGGQKQRVAIAGVIAMLPECIVFDESTSMLDPQGRREMIATMQMLNREKGITVIHITHNMDEAIKADRVVVINDGEITLDGTPNEVFSNVSKMHAIGLDVPQPTELLYELNLRGFNFRLDETDEDKIAKILADAINKGQLSNVE